jgi:hypothetical protein
MAFLENSPLGKISGKMGDLEFKVKKNGKNQVSQKRSKTKVKPTVVQKFQRNKMKVVMEFITPLSGLMKEYYRPFRKITSGFDAAKSYYLKEALTYTGEGYAIDYAKAMITFGDLRIPEGIQLDVHEENNKVDITLNWEDNSHQAMAYPDDRLLLVLNVTGSSRFYRFKYRANRDSLSVTVSLPRSKDPEELRLWMSFVRPEEKRASPSVYLGVVSC